MLPKYSKILENFLNLSEKVILIRNNNLFIFIEWLPAVTFPELSFA